METGLTVTQAPKARRVRFPDAPPQKTKVFSIIENLRSVEAHIA